MEGDARFAGMSDEEKDAYAQRLATPEYLDLTCDWAFKYLFHNHPDLLVMLLDDSQVDNYFSGMMTKEEMLPYIEGAERQGYSRGHEQGKAEGLAEGKIQAARGLLAMGFEPDKIAQATGLSTDEIEKLGK